VAVPLGVSIAFTAAPDVVDPAWTRIDTLPGCRVQSWSVSRGRPSEFEKTGAGTATVRIADLQGLFDPTNGASPYFPNVVPDKQAAIALRNPELGTWHTVFRGFIEDISYTLDQSRRVLWLELELVDGFGRLADVELMPGQDGLLPLPADIDAGHVFYAGGPVADRINFILDDAGWPAGTAPAGLREIFTGNVQLSQVIYPPGTDALSALYDAADAEFSGVANIYCSKDGVITFHGRQARFRPDVAEYHIRRQTVGDPSLTSVDSTVCPVHELGFNLGKASLYNSVSAYPQYAHATADTPPKLVEPTGAEIRDQLLEDAASIAAHGKKGLSFTDLLTWQGNATGNPALVETKLVAQYYRDNYHQPLPRVNRMVFKSRLPSDPLAGPLWKMLTLAEISDRLTFTSAHPGGGGFTADEYYVEGVRYQAEPGTPTVPNVTLELDVSPAALFTVNPFPDI
jgi:hypothetical protein